MIRQKTHVEKYKEDCISKSVEGQEEQKKCRIRKIEEYMYRRRTSLWYTHKEETFLLEYDNIYPGCQDQIGFVKKSSINKTRKR